MKQIDINIDVEVISKFLNEMILTPRKTALEWSKITKQTPALNIGYPSQHLSSLLTGYEGKRSGARGDDVSDGSEVKSCNRVDQVDECGECKEKVMRSEIKCSNCSSENIKRKEDSKWLFTIRSEKELQELITANRVLLILFDYPEFKDNNFDKIRIRAFEIYPKNPRHNRFVEIMKNYYYNIYLNNLEKNPKKVPAPKNFWPNSYQFYLSNPIKIFESIITSINDNPTIESINYITPLVDRSKLPSENLPKSLLKKNEQIIFSNIKEDYLTEEDRKDLILRD
jgi:hypothetical protein